MTELAENKNLLDESRISELFQEMMENEPDLMALFVPTDSDGQKEAFLKGEKLNPENQYDRLDTFDYEGSKAKILELLTEILAQPDLDPKFANAYQDFAQEYIDKIEFASLAQRINHATDPNEKLALEAEYMRLNIELFDEPDEEIYKGILAEKIKAIQAKNLTGNAEQIRAALLTMIPDLSDARDDVIFKPKQETIDWFDNVLEGEGGLLERLLRHIPEDEGQKFGPEELKEFFEMIIAKEFGDAAEGWTVVIEKALSITVKAHRKQIIIPPNRAPVDMKTLRYLVGHELGVHFLKSVTGSDSTLEVVKRGAAGYYNNEEGQGMVVEETLKGKVEPRGIEAYLAAGAGYFENKDFRQTYEMMWRLKVLGDITEGDVTEEQIEEKKGTQYNVVMRSRRGAGVPWFKDPSSYFNGSQNMWRHIEAIAQQSTGHQELALQQLFAMGRFDSLDQDTERTVYETATKSDKTLIDPTAEKAIYQAEATRIQDELRSKS